jgi:uncharacterized protein (TIGR02147 family)
MNKNNINIFAYIDYRKYLLDYYNYRKSIDAGFTHTYVCFKLGQENSKSYFSNVIKGRIDVTSTFIDRFIDFLSLDTNEAHYFRALVNYNQSSSAHEKEFFFDQLVRLNNTSHSLVDKKAYAYYKEWYHSAIRALLDIVDFNDDLNVLVKKIHPKISLKQARDSINLLKELELIVQNDQGFWKAADKVISTGVVGHDELIERFQIACLDHAKNVIINGANLDYRNITMTVSLSDEAFKQITERTKQYKSEIRSIVQKDQEKPSRVYHINLNLFPMSK